MEGLGEARAAAPREVVRQVLGAPLRAKAVAAVVPPALEVVVWPVRVDTLAGPAE